MKTQRKKSTVMFIKTFLAWLHDKFDPPKAETHVKFIGADTKKKLGKKVNHWLDKQTRKAAKKHKTFEYTVTPISTSAVMVSYRKKKLDNPT